MFLIGSGVNEIGWEDYQVLDVFSGTELAGLTYEHVFNQKEFPVVLGYHVTLDAGTGLVHIAPSYGADDFNIGQEYHLDMVNGVDDKGVLTEESGAFAGLYFEDANKAVVTKLDEMGILLKLKFITHSYPHDWRTKKPVIFRATDQWFCSIEPIREQLLHEINDEITWIPEWGKIRLHNMIKDRSDWCISRQRVWGVPIPIFYNEDGTEIMDYDIMMHVADLFREYGSNVWFERDAKDLLPEGYTNPHSPNGNFRKEEDIMDVWFDSGATHTSVMEARGLGYPADVYLEGCDQYRGWFNSSLICGVAVHGKAPYKAVISHGFTLDEKGNKMSKSLGNTVEPLKMVKLHGADVLRLWVASVDYTEDVRIGDNLMKQVKESYRKIRNTYRFMLGNLNGFDPEKDRVDYQDMLIYDKYMMHALNIGSFSAFATASLRNIDNTQEVLDRVKNDCDIKIDLLSGAQEGRLSFKGAIHGLAHDNGIYVDTGGGSSEIILYDHNQIGYVASLPIGSLNMFNKYVKAILPKAKEVKLMKERVMKELKDAEKDKGTFRCRYLAVTGGSMRALRSVLVSLKWIAKDCYEFDSNLLKELTKYFLEDEERCAHLFLKVKPDRIHTLFCGLVIIDTIAQYTQAEKIQVSMNGVREGYLIERVIGEQNAQKISVYPKS